MAETAEQKLVVEARVGRENQRYDEDGRRLTAGCVVVRENAAGERVFLVVSSSKDPSKCIFPKGGWENDETVEEGARRETLEEAGVVAELVKPLGWFEVSTAKSKTKCCLFHARCLEEREDWAEKGRKRHWQTEREIRAQAKYPYMLEALARLAGAES